MTSIAFFVIITSFVALLVVGTEHMGGGHTVFANRVSNCSRIKYDRYSPLTLYSMVFHNNNMSAKKKSSAKKKTKK
jgi:hypothetical protein